jgi:hypothetical protein
VVCPDRSVRTAAVTRLLRIVPELRERTIGELVEALASQRATGCTEE